MPVASTDEEKQLERCMATYEGDLWSKTYWPDGKLKTAMKVWYMCTAGGAGHECYTVTDGKAINEVRSWPAEARTYCCCCGARCRTVIGVLVELHTGAGDVFWMRATFPFEMLEVQWNRAGEDMGSVLTPEHVSARFQRVSPYMGNKMLRPVGQRDPFPGFPMQEGVCKVVDREYLRHLPMWEWRDLMSFAKMLERAPQ